MPANSQSLLIELGTEDLPARYVLPLATALAAGVIDGLKKRGIAFEAASEAAAEGSAPGLYATPRRIAVLLRGVAGRQPAQHVERKGPQLAAAFKDGQPTPAALGFARSCGVDVGKLKQENGQLVFRKTQPGRRTAELVPEIFAEALRQMDELVPKRMRWGEGTETFVRPVHWIVALYGSRVLRIERFGLKAGRKTYGHRFHAPAAIALKSADDYVAALQAAKVWVDFASRSQAIRGQVEAEAARLGGSARITPELLDEVTALVEWPVVISGRIEERFLQLPPEVVVATVETNQRYFTVFDARGGLLPRFITISNIESKDVAQVVAGNERVVRPRLTDALFFWEQDLKEPLVAKSGKLATVTYQKELGSLAQRVQRIEAIAAHIAQAAPPRLPGFDYDHESVRRAAQLCKSDLVTRMVYEFPELQGLMGGYYARASAESEPVAQAIAEHYRPAQSGAAIPSTPVGQIVALADKLDALAGIFAIGQKPTASKDPFGLRRAALGALRICIEGGIDLDLREALGHALQAQPAGKRDAAVLGELWDFVVERLRGYCLERGAGAEPFEAVRVMGASRPLDFVRRLDALRAFLATPAAATLAAADKRARNILRQAGGAAAADVETRLFEAPAEHALLAELERVETAVAPLRSRADYAPMLQALASLKEPVDAFFAGVMVMAEDAAVRGNRLALMARLDAMCREVVDLACLPG
ncbi:MAG: glycine--tRNA ligase subunit beta [Nevskia sp.]|nr:glycine--tRNA ligase subunit beta [Nevskia sp.]